MDEIINRIQYNMYQKCSLGNKEFIHSFIFQGFQICFKPDNITFLFFFCRLFELIKLLNTNEKSFFFAFLALRLNIVSWQFNKKQTNLERCKLRSTVKWPFYDDLTNVLSDIISMKKFAKLISLFLPAF